MKITKQRSTFGKWAFGSFLLYLVVASKLNLIKWQKPANSNGYVSSKCKSKVQKNQVVVTFLLKSFQIWHYPFFKGHQRVFFTRRTQNVRGLPHKPEMVVRDERYGVCPKELERKLQERLETRKQVELLKLET
ncbi:hypothetical protein HID58_029850 [Brassica napus]|uniref:Uncharacterized protein n=1 Tax=Brassica napus TaxID=3708 RepID=A0ABQ8CE91_BRANA|nr:hypothetical protein HID58_029850 [Brassica napus]